MVLRKTFNILIMMHNYILSLNTLLLYNLYIHIIFVKNLAENICSTKNKEIIHKYLSNLLYINYQIHLSIILFTKILKINFIKNIEYHYKFKYFLGGIKTVVGS